MLDGASSASDLEQGLASAAACLAARRSARTRSETAIRYGF